MLMCRGPIRDEVLRPHTFSLGGRGRTFCCCRSSWGADETVHKKRKMASCLYLVSVSLEWNFRSSIPVNTSCFVLVTLWYSVSFSLRDLTTSYYRLPSELQKGNVFSRFCHSVQGGSPSDHYPRCIRPQCTSPGPTSSTGHQTCDPQPNPLLVTSGGNY